MGTVKNPMLLPNVLKQGADELKTLKARLERIETQLERLYVNQSERLSGEEIFALQEIDLIIQSTDAVSGFLKTIADSQEISSISVCVYNATSVIGLRDLANRLEGGNTRTARSDPTAKEGLELF